MKEFIGLLSEHDVLEKYQLSKVTVAANALKLEVVNNNFKNELSSGVTDAEHQLKKALYEQTQSTPDKSIQYELIPDKLIPDDCSYKSDIKKLDVREESLVHFLLMHQDMLERLAHLLHVVELK